METIYLFETENKSYILQVFQKPLSVFLLSPVENIIKTYICVSAHAQAIINIHTKYNLFSIGEHCELLGRSSFLLPTSKNESSWRVADHNLNVKRHLYAFYAPENAV